MTEDELAELMKSELKKALAGYRKGKTMEETITQLDQEIKDQNIERARWHKK